MSLAAQYSPTTKRIDLRRGGGNLLTDDGLEAAVLISVFTYRRADEADELPPGVSDRQGWWGDAFARRPGDSTGSLMWLLSRSPLTNATLAEAKGYIENSLAWMLADGVASDVIVTTERRGDLFVFSVGVQRPGDAASRWQKTWEIRLDAI